VTNIATEKNQITETAVNARTTALKNSLSGALSSAGVSADFDLMQTPFTADGKGFDKVLDNIKVAKVDGMITAICQDSAEAALQFENESINGIWIDAAHDYNSVVKDLAAWYPKVKLEGIFSGHDWTWHEVSKAVKEHSEVNGWELVTHNNYWKRK
jgi:hypothetical protein